MYLSRMKQASCCLRIFLCIGYVEQDKVSRQWGGFALFLRACKRATKAVTFPIEGLYISVELYFLQIWII